MKHRSPLSVVLLSIVTLGIYDLYWLAKTKDTLNKTTSYQTPSIWVLISPLVLLVISYIGLFASAGGKSVNTYYGYGQTEVHHVSHPASFVIFIILMILGWVIFLAASAYWFFKYSKAVNQYTNGKMTTAVAFLVLWLIHLIGVALVQDAFNDMEVAAGPQVPPQSPPAQQPISVPPATTVQNSPELTAPVNPTQTPNTSENSGQDQAPNNQPPSDTNTV